MLRHGEGVFLDDVTLEQLSAALKRPVQVSETDGWSLAETIFQKENALGSLSEGAVSAKH